MVLFFHEDDETMVDAENTSTANLLQRANVIPRIGESIFPLDQDVKDYELEGFEYMVTKVDYCEFGNELIVAVDLKPVPQEDRRDNPNGYLSNICPN